MREGVGSEQARELFLSESFKDDLKSFKSESRSLWDGSAALTTRPASEDEIDAFYEALDEEDEVDVVEAAAFPKHILRHRNQRWAARVGLDTLTGDEWIAHFGRFEPLPGSFEEPLALRYHGHQFQTYNPDLGDGRGFLFAQLMDLHDGRLLDLGTCRCGNYALRRQLEGLERQLRLAALAAAAPSLGSPQVWWSPVEPLLAAIEDQLAATRTTLDRSIDASNGAAISWLHRNSEVLAKELRDGRYDMTVRVDETKRDILVNQYGAVPRPL